MPGIFSRSNDPHAFLKELSLLVSAGIPLSKALDIAKKTEYLQDIAGQIKAGRSLTDSLNRKTFAPAVINILSVGEKSGDLAGGLSRACIYLAKKDSIQKKMISALIYPAFVLLLCVVSLFILISVLLPAFDGIFSGLGVKLPLLSRLILGSSRFIPIIGLLLLASGYYLVKYVLGDKGFRVPLIGVFRKRMIIASYYRSMADSLRAGLNIVDSLQLSLSIISSALYKAKLTNAMNMVYEGSSLNESLLTADLFNTTDISLISAGEQASSLNRVFEQLALHHEEEIENNIKTFSSLVEPISTLATGIVVGIIVFAMFMPIIKLINVLGG